MGEVATATGVMTGLALFFAALLAVAYRYLRVEEDPRLELVEEMLPGNNCGACGEPGCAAFAQKLIGQQTEPGNCTVASADSLEEIASVLGVDIGGDEKRIARLRCAGGRSNTLPLADYRGLDSCRAAVVVDGGALGCNWGCLGLADCEKVCTFDAIRMNDEELPVVEPALCTACGDCVEVCPQDLFVLVPESQRLFVQCNSPLVGEDALSRCLVACDACGRCALDAPEGTVEMVNGLPVIHYEEDLKPGPEATWRCPTAAIQWLEDGQFEERDEEEIARRRGYG